MIVLGLGLALVGAAVAWEVVGGLPKPMRVEITKETLQVGLSRPTIWVFLNDSDTNSRSWSDFMARSSSAINIPILNLFYQTITKHNGDKYRIEVVGGLQRVAELMGGWEKLPTLMRNPKARINGPEEDWIRTALLAKYGGLWLSPSVVCLRWLCMARRYPDFARSGLLKQIIPSLWNGRPAFGIVWNSRTVADKCVETQSLIG